MQHQSLDVHVHRDRLLDAVARNDEAEVRANLARSGSVATAMLGLEIACTRGHATIAQVLLEYGARADDPRMLVDAARSLNPDLVRAMLAAGADPRYDHSKALAEAARLGGADIVELLIEAGADHRALADLASRTAAQEGHKSVLLVLHKHGADPRALDDWAYRAAWVKNREDVVDYLMTLGADNPQDERWRRVKGVSVFDPCHQADVEPTKPRRAPRSEAPQIEAPQIEAPQVETMPGPPTTAAGSAGATYAAPPEPAELAPSLSTPLPPAFLQPDLAQPKPQRPPAQGAPPPPPRKRLETAQPDLFSMAAAAPPEATPVRSDSTDLFANSVPGSRPPPPRRRP